MQNNPARDTGGNTTGPWPTASLIIAFEVALVYLALTGSAALLSRRLAQADARPTGLTA